MKLKPLEDRVIILQDDAKEVTESGLLVPEQSQHRPPIGTIVAIGPGKATAQQSPLGYLINDKFFATIMGQDISGDDRVVPVFTTAMKVGDRVYFANHAGTLVEEDKIKYLIMRFSDVICRE